MYIVVCICILPYIHMHYLGGMHKYVYRVPQKGFSCRLRELALRPEAESSNLRRKSLFRCAVHFGGLNPHNRHNYFKSDSRKGIFDALERP